MTIATRLRRALCRHDWLPLAGWPRYNNLRKCRKCGKYGEARVMQP